MLFIDRYDPLYLKYLDISGSRWSGNAIVSSQNLSSYIQPTNPNGEFRISDLTSILGDLNVGERYVITIKFLAKAVTQTTTTCNLAIADDGVDQKESTACLTIPYNPPPPTDR